MRSMFRVCFVATFAVFALGAVAVTAASAAEGPFYKIAGARLKAGESKELKAKASKEYVMRVGAGVVFKCTKQKLEKATISGSTGKNFGSGEETSVLEGCTVSGLSEGCEVENKTIKTQPLKAELVYETKEATETKERGKILVLFKPANSGIFGIIKFRNPSLCGKEELLLEGSVAAEVFSGGKAVEVGKEPTEAVANEVRFPKTAIKTIWVEKEGKLEEKKPNLDVPSTAQAVRVEGASELTLAGEPGWGVFTQ